MGSPLAGYHDSHFLIPKMENDAIAPQIDHAELKGRNQRIQLPFSDLEAAKQLFGEHNCNLKRVAETLRVTIDTRGSTVFIEGEDIDVPLAGNVLTQLYDLIKGQYPIYPQDIDYAIKLLRQ